MGLIGDMGKDKIIGIARKKLDSINEDQLNLERKDKLDEIKSILDSDPDTDEIIECVERIKEFRNQG